MTGPSPKSYCNHNPGSVTQGRWIRAFPSRYCFLTCGDRPPGRPLRPGEPHRHQLVVGDVGADLALRLLDPFLDLRQELVDQPRPARPRRGAAGVPFGDQSGDGVVRAPRQVRGGTQRTESNRTQPVFPSIPRQTSQWSLLGARRARQHRQADFRRDPNRGTRPGRARACRVNHPRSRWAVSWPPVGRNRGHQRAVSWPPMGSFSWPRTFTVARRAARAVAITDPDHRRQLRGPVETIEQSAAPRDDPGTHFLGSTKAGGPAETRWPIWSPWN